MKALNTTLEHSVMTGMLRKNTQREISRRTSVIYPKATPENRYYRFRLLSFAPDEEFTKSAGLTYYRDIAFLPRHMHVVWTDEPSDKSPTGTVRRSHEIVCPSSEYIRINSNLNAKACPICSSGNQALTAYKESNRTNQVALKKWMNCRYSVEALVPVYVIDDPNNDAINGSVKIWRPNEEQYKRLVALINEAERGKTPIWNENAVDLYFSYGDTEKSRTNKKTGETKTWTQKDIIKFGFTTTPHPIQGLDELVKGLNFDASWYTIPTMEELQDFYAKYIASSPAALNDIPNDIPLTSAPAGKDEFKELSAFDAAPVEPPTKVAAPVDDIPAAKPAKNDPNLDSDIDSFMKGIKL